MDIRGSDCTRTAQAGACLCLPVLHGTLDLLRFKARAMPGSSLGVSMRLWEGLHQRWLSGRPGCQTGRPAPFASACSTADASTCSPRRRGFRKSLVSEGSICLGR